MNLRVQGAGGPRAASRPWQQPVEGLALVTLGLYIAGSLMMQHRMGPRIYGDIPRLAAFAFGLALRFTFRLARGIA